MSEVGLSLAPTISARRPSPTSSDGVPLSQVRKDGRGTAVVQDAGEPRMMAAVGRTVAREEHGGAGQRTYESEEEFRSQGGVLPRVRPCPGAISSGPSMVTSQYVIVVKLLTLITPVIERERLIEREHVDAAPVHGQLERQHELVAG